VSNAVAHYYGNRWVRLLNFTSGQGIKYGTSQKSQKCQRATKGEKCSHYNPSGWTWSRKMDLLLHILVATYYTTDWVHGKFKKPRIQYLIFLTIIIIPFTLYSLTTSRAHIYFMFVKAVPYNQAFTVVVSKISATVSMHPSRMLISIYRWTWKRHEIKQ